MHENIVKINLTTFVSSYNKQKSENIPDTILEKVNFYKKNYNCFNSYYDPKMIWEKKRGIRKEDKPVKNRFHIIIPDFSDDGVIKREIISLLNKLTDKNKDIIYKKLVQLIEENNDNEDYFRLIWSYTKTTDSELYLDVLKFYKTDFFNKHIENLWNKYISDKEWKPPAYIFENNLLHSNEDYDMYCNYIKWKKEIHNLNLVWIKTKKDIDLLLNDIYSFLLDYMNERTEYTVYKYIIDIFLEEIYRILKYHKNEDIINRFRVMDIGNFESSSKFLVYSIIEKK